MMAENSRIIYLQEKQNRRTEKRGKMRPETIYVNVFSKYTLIYFGITQASVNIISQTFAWAALKVHVKRNLLLSHSKVH